MPRSSSLWCPFLPQFRTTWLYIFLLPQLLWVYLSIFPIRCGLASWIFFRRLSNRSHCTSKKLFLSCRFEHKSVCNQDSVLDMIRDWHDSCCAIWWENRLCILWEFSEQTQCEVFIYITRINYFTTQNITFTIDIATTGNKKIILFEVNTSKQKSTPKLKQNTTSSKQLVNN